MVLESMLSPGGCSVMCDEQGTIHGPHPVPFCVASVSLWVNVGILLTAWASQLPGTAKYMEMACSQQLWMLSSVFQGCLAFHGCMLVCNGQWVCAAHVQLHAAHLRAVALHWYLP